MCIFCSSTQAWDKTQLKCPCWKAKKGPLSLPSPNPSGHVHREFFVFRAMKAGPDLLRSEGANGRQVEWRDDAAALQRWACGATGLPFVDACMRELAATGYMSNRGRQNVASLLCKARIALYALTCSDAAWRQAAAHKMRTK